MRTTGRTGDVAALIGRVAVGVVFLVHGLDKWNSGIPAIAGFMGSVGIPLPMVAATFTIAVEVVGSIAFILGLLTPLVALAYAAIAVGAVFFVHLDAGLTGPDGYELILVLALSAVAIGFNAGRLSLDHVLAGRIRARKDAASEPAAQVS